MLDLTGNNQNIRPKRSLNLLLKIHYSIFYHDLNYQRITVFSYIKPIEKCKKKKKCLEFLPFDQKLLLDSAKELLENCFWIRPNNSLKIASGFDQRTAWKLLLDSAKELLENCFWIRPKNCLKIASGFGQRTAWTSFWIRPNNSLKIASGFDQRTAWKLLLDSAKELLENCFWIRPKNCLKIASGFGQRTAWKLLLDSSKKLLENCFWIWPKNCLDFLLDSTKKLFTFDTTFSSKNSLISLGQFFMVKG